MAENGILLGLPNVEGKYLLHGVCQMNELKPRVLRSRESRVFIIITSWRAIDVVRLAYTMKQVF